MKQTKSKKSMKQFLTLMLAFIMVFTGMGIGSWGVDTAWADELPFAIMDDEGKTFSFKKLGFFDNYLYVNEVEIENQNIYLKVRFDSQTVQIADINYNYNIYEGIEQGGNKIDGFEYNGDTNTYTLPISMFSVPVENLQFLTKNYAIPIDGSAVYYSLAMADVGGGEHYFLKAGKR